MARWLSPRKQHAPQSRGGRGVHGAALAAALWLHAGAGVAAQDCAGQAGATLLRQQLLPDTPVRYLACKLPAASRDGRQIAIADDGDTVGPSSCQNQVCTFKAADGRAVKRWDLQAAPPGDTLDARMAALAEALRADGFTPMTSLQPGISPRGTVLTGAGTRVEFHHSARRAWLEIRVEGRAPIRYRFASRLMRCQAEPPRRTLPSEVRAWAQDGVAALVVAAQFPASEAGCSWTEWVVVPLAAASKP